VVKQGALTAELNILQQRLSDIESEEKVNEDMMEQVAKILEMPTEAIKNFDEQAAINIISRTLHNTNGLINYFPSFNPIDKLVDTFEENKKLYERLLASEQVKVSLFQKILNK
jgi:hypothetical protein